MKVRRGWRGSKKDRKPTVISEVLVKRGESEVDARVHNKNAISFKYNSKYKTGMRVGDPNA